MDFWENLVRGHAAMRRSCITPYFVMSYASLDFCDRVKFRPAPLGLPNREFERTHRNAGRDRWTANRSGRRVVQTLGTPLDTMPATGNGRPTTIAHGGTAMPVLLV